MDRTALILGLGGLAAEAALRGDDRAADLLRHTVEFLIRDSADVEARQKKRDRDAERLAARRATRATPGQSRDIGDPPGFSPTPPFPTPQQQIHDTPRTRDAEMIETLTVLLEKRMGSDFPDADAFLKRRQFSTWLGWLREMLKMVQDGSQFMPCDLAQVCRDDAALERPVGSPYGLRQFLRGALEERLRPRTPHATNGIASRPAASPSEAQRVVDTIRSLMVVEHPAGQPNPSRFIPIDKVKAMGPRVLVAYKQLGGAGRFMDCPADKLIFLVRDMAEKLEHATA